MTSEGAPVGVISNPGSGHNRDQFARIAARIDACAGIMHRVTAAPADIAPALAEFAAAGIGTLAINGGDGTAAAVLGYLLEREPFPATPLIALLPGGTANMTAGDIGIGGSLPRAVERFCTWVSRPAGERVIERRSLMRLAHDTHGSPHYGMFLGAGAVIHGTEYAHREIHSRGVRDDLSLALGTVRTVWGVVRNDPAFTQPARIRLALDNQPAQEHDTLVLALSTLHRLAFGMRPFWGTGDGPLRLTLIEQHCARFLRNFVAIARGRAGIDAQPENGYHSHNARRITLEADDALNLDGEILSLPGPVTITASRPLAFLQL